MIDYRIGNYSKMNNLNEDSPTLNLEDIKTIYEENTNLRRCDLSKILKHDINWDANTCLEKGLIDEIL